MPFVKAPNTIKVEMTFTFVKVTTNSESNRVCPKRNAQYFFQLSLFCSITQFTLKSFSVSP